MSIWPSPKLSIKLNKLTLLKKDLHGLTYSEVEDMLPNWILTNYNNGHHDFEIITGNSFQMKNLVKKICLEYGFHAAESFNGNTGSLTVGIKSI